MARKRILVAAAALALTACGTDASTSDAAIAPGTDGGVTPGTDGSVAPGTDGGVTPGGWRAVPITAGADERVTGIYCSDAHTCVVATNPFGEVGHIYATDAHTITGTLVTGDAAFAEPLGTLGDVGFLGFSHVGDRLIAHIIGAEGGFLSATGTITAAASWTAVPAGAGDFGLNAQFGYGGSGTRVVLMAQGRMWETTNAPGPSAAWTNIYSPQAVPPIPANINDLRAADPTLCNTDPSVSISPNLTQGVYIASDLSLIVTPAGAVNQDGDDEAGVCISTDGGHTFHHSAFAGLEIGLGPVGVACSSINHCVAYGGTSFQPDSMYIFVSNDASMGASSTWTRATTPTLVENTGFRSVAFAPDGMHGWIVGTAGASAPLLYATTDGGATWTDQTSMIRALAPDTRLHTVYAFDATHAWIGGEHDTLLTIGD